MGKRFVYFSFIAILLLAMSFPSHASGAPQEVLNAVNSVVYIEVEAVDALGSGSGFVIKNGPDGTLIATNHHVVEDNPFGVYVWVDVDDKRSATVVASSEQLDIAIIKLAVPINAEPLMLTADARQGDEVYAIGFPAAANSLSSTTARLSNEASITNGLINSVRSMRPVDYGPQVKLLQINADINPGNSGGPLLNVQAEVVGVCTYGVLDSQGIFGAIAASELIDFLSANNISLGTSKAAFSADWLIWGGAAVLIAAIIVGVLLLTRKSSRTNKYKSPAKIPLEDYLSRLSSGLDASSAVTLLMPVMLVLRDKHNQGSVFLNLSPARLVVTKQGCILRESAERIPEKYVAPEQNAGRFSGVKVDIFSVCAVLRHMLLYHIQDISEAEQKLLDPAVQALLDIAMRGMAENPEDRYATMQDLIYEVSAFNNGISEYALAPAPTVQASRRRSFAPIFAIIITGLCFMTLAFSAYNYFISQKAMQAYKFAEADSALNRIPFVVAFFPDERLFVDAGLALDAREYDDAIVMFAMLEDYQGAADGAREAKYRKAAMLADNNSYDSAISIYKEIIGYKDSAGLITDTRFRHAGYFILVHKDYKGALSILESLSREGKEGADSKILEAYYYWGHDDLQNEHYLDAYAKFVRAGNYADAKVVLDDLTELIYYLAIDDYHAGKYINAKNKFLTISKTSRYADSDAYLVLIAAHLAYSNAELPVWTKLVSLIGFEDAADLIVSRQELAVPFLIGQWRGDSKKFDMEKDGGISYTVPWIDYGEYYRIENGRVLLYYDKTYQTTKTMWEITVISKDCIQLYAYKNGKVYTLFRR